MWRPAASAASGRMVLDHFCSRSSIFELKALLYILIRPGFKVYVRPILEYCSSVWSPYLIKDIQSIENIQRFFTRKVLYKFDLEYKQRLSVLNLESLEYRRLKTDLVMYYKIIHNLIDLNCEDFFKFSRHSLTRSHNLTLTKPICKTNLYLNSFSNRLINVWNKLPIDVVNAPSLPSFVNSIKKLISPLSLYSNKGYFLPFCFVVWSCSSCGEM